MASKLCTATQSVAAIPDGATVAITGSGGGLLEPDTILAALGARFLASGHPRDLTLVHAQGIGDGKARGLNHLAHDGMIKRVIGAHWTWSPAMQQLAASECIEAFALPGGVIQHLIRESGAGRPGLITKVGIGTFVDPRLEGGAMNRRAANCAPLVKVITVEGEEYLHFLPLKIDVAIVRGTASDAKGNVDFHGEGGELDAVVLAMAARNGGGQVLVQVRELAGPGERSPAAVRLPGTWVDHVVIDPNQVGSHQGEPADIAEGSAAQVPLERRIIAHRAERELQAGQVVSFGFGIPDGVTIRARETGKLNALHTTLDHGHHGGVAFQGMLFGFVRDGEARVDSPTQFDFYSGGGIDVAVLGFGECDATGNINVSKLGGSIIGPGGFIDIAQNARTVIFCGTLEAKGLRIGAVDGELRINEPGKVAKFVKNVEQITFSAEQARRQGQRVLYITERAMFELGPNGPVLIEHAPGIDIKRDIVARMGFRPGIASGLGVMDTGSLLLTSE